MEINIAVDAMGADAGVSVVVEGAVSSLSDPKIGRIILVGREDEIEAHLAKLTYDKGRVEVVHASEVIDPKEVPTVAIKTKKDSSIVVGLKLVKEGRAAAFVSAGSTGAVLAGATLHVGRIRGIKRPALGVLIPNTTEGYTFIMDVGANMDTKPEYLVQFAQMGSVYMEKIMRVKSPKVGLINVGVEEDKGNAQTKEAFGLLSEASGINFAGNVESREITYGAVDVAVCDGFVGNVLLKYAEGSAKGIFALLKRELTAGTVSKIGGLLAKKAFGRIRKKFDYTEIGGSPFMGLNGLVVKAHGSSNAKAIRSSIRQCVRFIETDVVGEIKAMQEGERDGISEG
ncbi:MAG: phosphate acyltransferase PlsX [Defluviitaleaceae bacterium]|nr:phosphate acyltransferase PlsX [Defluviitaleaceae bacterium]